MLRSFLPREKSGVASVCPSRSGETDRRRQTVKTQSVWERLAHIQQWTEQTHVDDRLVSVHKSLLWNIKVKLTLARRWQRRVTAQWSSAATAGQRRPHSPPQYIRTLTPPPGFVLEFTKCTLTSTHTQTSIVLTPMHFWSTVLSIIEATSPVALVWLLLQSLR